MGSRSADKCTSPGCCDCPRMARCPSCGYTRHDAVHLMDHRFCRDAGFFDKPGRHSPQHEEPEKR